MGHAYRDFKTNYVLIGRVQCPQADEPLHILEHEIREDTKSENLGSIQISNPSTGPGPEVSNRIASPADAWLKLSKLYNVRDRTTPADRSNVFCIKSLCNFKENFKVSLKEKINNYIMLGWCNIAKVSNIVSRKRLRWLGHLPRTRNDRLTKRATEPLSH